MSPPLKHVSAAGGVVWRGRPSRPEVLLVHRPRYGDWSLPKGKLLAGESELTAAVREVSEEVGARVAVQQRLAPVKYTIADVRKRVSYWAMRHLDGEFAPNDEVDEACWLPVREADRMLSYDVDRGVLQDFAGSPVADAVVVLVRHAKAGRRSDWDGDDSLRPLDENGRRQARDLATVLTRFAPTAVVCADRTRCIETVMPLAAATGLEVDVDPRFADDNFEAGPGGTQTALLTLAKPGTVTVICSQGGTIPALVDELGPGLRPSDTRKGAWWVLTLVDGDVATADHYGPP